jgi:hypothetical protein
MTSKKRKEATALALQYMLAHGQAPNWREDPYNGDPLLEVVQDRKEGCYFRLIRHEKFIGMITPARRVVVCRSDTVYKSIFQDYARDSSFKFRQVSELRFPSSHNTENVSWFGHIVEAVVRESRPESINYSGRAYANTISLPTTGPPF